MILYYCDSIYSPITLR